MKSIRPTKLWLSGRSYLGAQHHGMDMTMTEWRLAREEIARLKAMLGKDDDGGEA